MATFSSLAGLAERAPARVRQIRNGRAERVTTVRAVRQSLVSLAGLVGSVVLNQVGEPVGQLDDLVVRVDGGVVYPPVAGLVVRVGRRRAFVDASAIAAVDPDRVRLGEARLDLREFQSRPGELLLAQDVLDHQLVDVDGVQVIRAADLYLARVGDEVRLVGVDVSLQSLVRRLGPKRWRTRPTPERVIDWGSIAPLGERDESVAGLPLRSSREALRRLRPAELADLLESLDRKQQGDLLDYLDPQVAADALEEMEVRPGSVLLRDADTGQAATLLSHMEPDEAVDALRTMPAGERSQLLARMPAQPAANLARLLEYPAGTAGGMMTSLLVVAAEEESVASVRAKLAAQAEHHGEIDAVVVVDEDGRLRADLPLFDVAIAQDTSTVAQVLDRPGQDYPPLAVHERAGLADVAEQLIDARRSSVVVVDDGGRPVGRILADDVVDALRPSRSGRHFPRLLS